MLQRAHISNPVRAVERLDALTGLRFFAAAAIGPAKRSHA
jgi:hypothetical protein